MRTTIIYFGGLVKRYRKLTKGCRIIRNYSYYIARKLFDYLFNYKSALVIFNTCIFITERCKYVHKKQSI